MNEMRSHKVVTIALLVIVLLITFTGMVCADQNVPAIPEIQGLATATGMNVQGTIAETDAGRELESAGIPLKRRRSFSSELSRTGHYGEDTRDF